MISDVFVIGWYDVVVQVVFIYLWLVYLMVIDGIGECGQDFDIIVVCCFENYDGDDVIIFICVFCDGGILDLIVGVLVGVFWYQWEIYDFFGVRFVGFGVDDCVFFVYDVLKLFLCKEVVLVQ